MDRNEAYQFIQLYEKFLMNAGEYAKITDLDPATEQIELQFLDGSGVRRWYDYWNAAKVIEAHQ